MKTRHVIGQRIVAVHQGQTRGGQCYGTMTAVHWIELENGVRLFPLAQETETESVVDFVVNTVGRKKRPARTKTPEPAGR